MIPPTPTLLPPGTPYLEVPDNFSLWANTSPAIQFWNGFLGDFGLILQVLLLIVIILAGIFVLRRFFTDSTSEDSKK